jgi:hypothetical protein
MPVIVRLKGGIGNQLFIYAAARRLALANNHELLLDDVSGFVNDIKFKRRYQLDHFNILSRKANSNERLEPFSRIRRFLKKIYNYFLPFKNKNYLKKDDSNFDKRIMNLKIKDKLYLEGYFQSEKYFKDIDFQIRKDLQIKTPKDNLNKNIALMIKKSSTSVAIHFRYFQENLTNKNNIKSFENLSKDYYLKAIERIDNFFPNANYFLFSDRIEEAKNLLSFLDKRITVVSHNNNDSTAFADLWLMTLCQHFIIANSTFSWWGAWLAKNPKKIVIAPRINNFSNGSWKNNNLIPENWIQI